MYSQPNMFLPTLKCMNAAQTDQNFKLNLRKLTQFGLRLSY